MAAIMRRTPLLLDDRGSACLLLPPQLRVLPLRRRLGWRSVVSSWSSAVLEARAPSCRGVAAAPTTEVREWGVALLRPGLGGVHRRPGSCASCVKARLREWCPRPTNPQ
jgi:hypothetical protein